MKVAILSESPADEAAIRILIEGILGESIETMTLRARPGGRNAAIRAISPTLKDLHYHRTADALVVVIDSDNSQVHDALHEELEDVPDDCHTCELRSAIKRCQDELTTRPGLSVIPTAVAVPTPAMEAWYLFKEDSDCTEAGWKQRQQTKVSSVGEIRRLKIKAYGNDRPSIELEKTVAIKHAHRLVDRLDELEGYFPNSFGLLAREIRTWM